VVEEVAPSIEEIIPQPVKHNKRQAKKSIKKTSNE
jgi:hypothetical protein